MARIQTLTEQVANQITIEIQGGSFPIGSKLPSGRELALRFGVSQAVIREVTESLRSLGLIDSRQGAGCVVKSRTITSGFRVPNTFGVDKVDLARVFDLRLGLESAAAMLAAANRADEDIAALRDILGTLEQNLYNPDRAVELDMSFHAAVARATQNHYYVDLLQYVNLQIRKSVETARANSLLHDHMPATVHAEHMAVFEAIRAQAPQAAHEKMAIHVRSAAGRVGLAICWPESIEGGTLDAQVPDQRLSSAAEKR